MDCFGWWQSCAVVGWLRWWLLLQGCRASVRQAGEVSSGEAFRWAVRFAHFCSAVVCLLQVSVLHGDGACVCVRHLSVLARASVSYPRRAEPAGQGLAS